MLSSDDVFPETPARYRAVEPDSGSNVIPRRARPGLAGLAGLIRPHTQRRALERVAPEPVADIADNVRDQAPLLRRDLGDRVLGGSSRVQ